MRIALVSDCYLPRLGGIELQVHDLAVQLSRAGHAVTVFTTTDGPSAAGDVPVVRLPALTGIPLPAASDTLRRALDSFDVVHAHTSLLSPLSWQAARHAVAPIITMHSLPNASMPWPLARLDRYIGEAKWTAVSGVVADRLRRWLPDKPIDVLHNGVDPDHWRQRRQPGHPLTIVSTMRLARRKRPLALLRALARIREIVPAGTAIRAIVVGAGPQARAVSAEARGLGLTSWVDLPGRLTRFEIQQLYATADIYLAPAELESFGVAALEARCAGLPVIAMASGGVGEFIRHGVEGYLVDNDAQMAEAAATLLTSPALLSRMQDHNYTTDPGMTWGHVVAQHVAAYRTQVSLSALPLASAS